MRTSLRDTRSAATRPSSRSSAETKRAGSCGHRGRQRARPQVRNAAERAYGWVAASILILRNDRTPTGSSRHRADISSTGNSHSVLTIRKNKAFKTAAWTKTCGKRTNCGLRWLTRRAGRAVERMSVDGSPRAVLDRGVFQIFRRMQALGEACAEAAQCSGGRSSPFIPPLGRAAGRYSPAIRRCASTASPVRGRRQAGAPLIVSLSSRNRATARPAFARRPRRRGPGGSAPAGRRSAR